MFIIELTELEPEFIKKSTETKECIKTRSFDINHRAAMYAYYYNDHVQIQLMKYGKQEMNSGDWKIIKRFPILLNDININKPVRISHNLEDDYLNIYLGYQNKKVDKKK
ncbi:hypothetical protein FEZ48_02650 [Marinilactibacillus psychrotolerans]|uniref:Uncharacterized protein n=1 Tax=Marinilactibacillus psychrotolerans TaxID=191770 RepID=A0A5R9C6Q7_9LACT|nr:hypothetical protein [Marinilactibacillus psychrotolerans]TLQ08802.1 hypothetical protein FEZ48_02650 [Marinilactibacillus psychrotolerans]